jgi:hypothetical protein
MDKQTAINLKRNLDESRKVWAKYPGECEGAINQFCNKCDHRMIGVNLAPALVNSINCQFELAPLTSRGLPCPYYSHTV